MTNTIHYHLFSDIFNIAVLAEIIFIPTVVLAEETDEATRGEKFLEHFDKNDDGKIGPHERKRAQKIHDRVDLNDDGRVGKRER